MKQAVILGIAFATAISLPALPISWGRWPIIVTFLITGIEMSSKGLSPRTRRRGARRLSALPIPGVAPYPDGRGDEDGLSRDPNDCNKGCIGGNSG